MKLSIGTFFFFFWIFENFKLELESLLAFQEFREFFKIRTVRSVLSDEHPYLISLKKRALFIFKRHTLCKIIKINI